MYYRPPEWQRNKEIWLAWPFDYSLWRDDLVGAQQEFVALINALKGERLVILFPTIAEHAAHVQHFAHLGGVTTKVMPYGDIWLRDTFPIAVKNADLEPFLVIPTFNGWGGKYRLPGDHKLSLRAAAELKWPLVESSLVFEGGAIESDGAGTLLTTEQCLLNQNRNPGWTKLQIEQELSSLFGARAIIWLKEGLKNDHTDGHIDTIARFLGPGLVAIMVPRDKDDPNYDVLLSIKECLSAETDAHGRPLTLIELPSCGMVENSEGKPLPASFLNFIIGDNTLAMPTYGTPFDQEAKDILQKHSALPVVASSARVILEGGGAFHCISQEFYFG